MGLSVYLFLALLAAVGLLRLIELRISRRHQESLLAGGAASKLGAPHTVMLGGSICILSAIWFALRLGEIRRVVRPIYVQLGILPEMASGLSGAAELTVPPEPS